MDYNSITLEVINAYLKDVKKCEIVANLDSNLYNDLTIDSLDTIELCFIVEEKYKITVEIDEMMRANLMTVRQVSEFLSKYNKTPQNG